MNLKECISKTVKELESERRDLRFVCQFSQEQMIPQKDSLRHLIREVSFFVFPEYYLESKGQALEERLLTFGQKLTDQILCGICFDCRTSEQDQDKREHNCRERAEVVACEFINFLPTLRSHLLADAEACFQGDPAATSIDEVIFTYPGLVSMLHHRVAHFLYNNKIPILPRFIAEICHSKTGIDIHPGATISPGLFIDHGTGIVIGETTIIGNRVRIYQGVTLGAKSFPLDEFGNPIKGMPRHPIIEDDVILYAGATILGRITLGKGCVVGGNLWVTDDVPAGVMVTQKTREQM